MSYLLDTCVISELVAKQPNQKVVDWIDRIDNEQLFLSVITLGEIERGVEKLPDSKRKQVLRTWLDTELPARFSGRILAIDADVMRVWGRLTAQLEKSGRPMPAMDSLIAAIALHANLQLVTRNEDDFADAGVSIVNP
jgi:tRNA(fMet)-specific endonuclease VapC